MSPIQVTFSHRVNCWLFQVPQNITSESLFRKVPAKVELPVSRYYEEIKKGHEALIWFSGESGGIYGVGKVTSDPLWTPVDSPLIKICDKYVEVEVTTELKTPIYKDSLLRDPVLRKMLIFQFPTRFVFAVYDKEMDVLKEVIWLHNQGKTPESMLGSHGPNPDKAL